MEPLSILYAMAGIVATAAIAYWAGQSRDTVNKKDGVLEQVVKDIEQLKAVAVSEQRVREIIKDALEPTSSDVKDIKRAIVEMTKTLQHIQVDFATEKAYRQGKNSPQSGV